MNSQCITTSTTPKTYEMEEIKNKICEETNKGRKCFPLIKIDYIRLRKLLYYTHVESIGFEIR